MELGLISDVHANLPALEAVFEDMPESVDEVACLGDVVGYNPYPVECVDQVQEECSYVLQGNHDREIRNPSYGSNQQAVKGLQLAEDRMEEEDIEYLLELPETQELADGDILAAHSHPENTDEYVFPSGFSDIERYLDSYDAVVLGHTHLQAVEQFEEGVVLNPGSVGQPRDEATAAYAVLDTESWETELGRTSYDIWRVVEEIEKTGLPPGTGDRLLPESRGQSQGRGGGNPWSTGGRRR
ncbi:metallophosphoesterase family protein [Halorarum halobium]|uniref:metallophosphoesterase family protein n=1 Tax=Halorarum halobium TaxID=3075121 RepID=UPI0028B05C56|nr:metallophosphoesterase family protein [Halobaculum sp. XH14]